MRLLRHASPPRRYVVLFCLSGLILWTFLRSGIRLLPTPIGVDTYAATHSGLLSARSSQQYSSWPLIPRKIWQTASDADQDTRNILENTWHTLNPTWRYELLNDHGASTFVNETFLLNRPDIVDVYHRIDTPIIKVDFLRYLLIWHYGGLYADVDVDCVKAINMWLPKEMRDKTGMILGLEYDDSVHEDMPNISLAQYIFMARPGHPILEAIVAEALLQLEALGRRGVSSGDYRNGLIDASTPGDVLEATGPYMFSRIIFSSLARLSPEFTHSSQLHMIREPVMFGDVVILPINGFGWGQEHSRSGELDMGQVLAEHHFRRSWRDPVTWELEFSWRKKAEHGQALNSPVGLP